MFKSKRLIGGAILIKLEILWSKQTHLKRGLMGRYKNNDCKKLNCDNN